MLSYEAPDDKVGFLVPGDERSDIQRFMRAWSFATSICWYISLGDSLAERRHRGESLLIRFGGRRWPMTTRLM